MNKTKVLIIRFSALGDVAMTVPIVRELAILAPELDITVMSQPFCGVFFEDLSPNIHFLGVDIKKEYHGIDGLNRLFRMLDDMQFTHIADLHGVLRTHYLCLRFRLANFFGKMTLSYKNRDYHVLQIDKLRSERKSITAQGNKKLQQMTTSFEKYRRVLKTLLSDVVEVEHWVDSSVKNFLPPLYYDNEMITEILKAVPVPRKGRGVGLAPFAAHEGKIYPLSLTQRFIELLTDEEPDCVIYLFGGGGKEEEKMREWKDLLPDNIVVVKDLVKGLKNEMALMTALDCMVTMDSANMHLASLVGTRVVSVWGATHPYAGFLGWQQSMDDCVQVDLPCRPCSIYGSKPCRRGDFACMKMIRPEEIVARILSE